MTDPFQCKLSVPDICGHIEMSRQINDNNNEAKKKTSIN